MEKSSFNTEFQQTDTASKIVAAMERLSEAFRVLLWEHAKVIELSPIQIQLMIFVAYHAEHLCNVSHLAQEFNMTKPTISDAVRILNQKGLIEKRISEVDKRAYTIALTTAGKAVVKQTEQFAKPIRQTIEDQLDESAQTALFTSLNKVMYGLNQQGILSEQRTCYGCRYYQQSGKQAFCSLMEKTLMQADIRIDCGEFERKESGAQD